LFFSNCFRQIAQNKGYFYVKVNKRSILMFFSMIFMDYERLLNKRMVK
jgi:hypothetical protein